LPQIVQSSAPGTEAGDAQLRDPVFEMRNDGVGAVEHARRLSGEIGAEPDRFCGCAFRTYGSFSVARFRKDSVKLNCRMARMLHGAGQVR